MSGEETETSVVGTTFSDSTYSSDPISHSRLTDLDRTFSSNSRYSEGIEDQDTNEANVVSNASYIFHNAGEITRESMVESLMVDGQPNDYNYQGKIYP